MRTQNENWVTGLTARDRRNIRPYSIISLLWAFSYAAAALFLPRGEGILEEQPLWGWMLTAVAIATTGLLAFYYLRFVRGLDELWRRIHLHAMATAFGVAFVWGMSAYLLGQMGVPKVEKLTVLIMFMTYWAMLFRGLRTINE